MGNFFIKELPVIIGVLTFVIVVLSIATFFLYLGFKNFKELIKDLTEDKK